MWRFSEVGFGVVITSGGCEEVVTFTPLVFKVVVYLDLLPFAICVKLRQYLMLVLCSRACLIVGGAITIEAKAILVAVSIAV